MLAPPTPTARKQLRPQRRLAAPDRTAPRRRRQRRRQAPPRSTAQPQAADRSARRSSICCRGTPSPSGKIVRRLSCRPTRSHSAAASAARPARPVSRTASGIVVGAAARRPPGGQEPQPLLRERQRQPAGRGCATSGSAAPASPRSPQRRRASAATRRRLEQRCGSAPRRRAPHAIRLTSRVASSECPPSSKKLSWMPTRSTPSTSANSRAQDLLLRRARRRERRPRRQLRRGQRAPVELAVRRQRQPLQHHKRRRHHVVGQPLRQRPRAARRASAQPRCRRHHIGHQPLVARDRPPARPPPPAPPPDAAASAASISPGSMRKPRIFTCHPPGPGTPAPRPAASAPGPRSGTSGSPQHRTRIGHKPLRRQPRTVQIPRASPAPARYSSPATPTGTGSRPPSSTYTRVFQIGGRSAPRASGRPAGPARHVDRGLGRPVQVVQLNRGR